MEIRKGFVGMCIGEYIAIRKLEIKIEKRNIELNKWMKKLTDEEFKEYADYTSRLEEAENFLGRSLQIALDSVPIFSWFINS